MRSIVVALVISALGAPAWAEEQVVPSADTSTKSQKAEPPSGSKEKWKTWGTLAAPPTATPPAAGSVKKRAARARRAKKKAKAPLPAPVKKMTPEEELVDRIFRRAQHLRTGNAPKAAHELVMLEETRLAWGSDNMILAAFALIRESSRATKAGAHGRAVERAEAAGRLAPDMPAAHWVRVRAIAAQDWTQVGSIASALSDLATAKVLGFRNAVSSLANLSLLLGLAMFAVITMFALSQIARYFRYAAHDFANFLPGPVTTVQSVVFLGLLVFAPILFLQSLGLSLLLVFTVVVGHQKVRERVFAGLSVFAIAVVPTLLYYTVPLLALPGSAAEAVDTLLSTALVEDVEKVFRPSISEQRIFVESALILSSVHRARGDLTQAESDIAGVLKIDPENSAAHNNLGVIRHLQRREEEAEKSFRLAAKSRSFPHPHLNLVSMLVERGQFEEANRLLDEARRIDPIFTEAHHFEEDAIEKHKLLDITVDPELPWRLLYNLPDDDRAELVDNLWRPVGGRLHRLFAPPLAALVFVFGFWLIRKKKAFSKACPRCGQARPGESDAPYCVQCETIFSPSSHVEMAVRTKKEREVTRFQRRHQILQWTFGLLGGAGGFFSGRSVRGWCLSFVWSFAAATLYFSHGFVPNAWDLGADQVASNIHYGLWAFVLLLVTVLSMRFGSEE